MKVRLATIALMAVMSFAAKAQTPVAQPPAEAFAAAIARQIPQSATVVILPVTDGRLDLSAGRIAGMAAETTAALRARGIAVRSVAEAPLRNLAIRAVGTSRPVGRTGLKEFSDSAGIGLMVLMALAETYDNSTSVETSIYSSMNGMFDQIWESRVGWRAEKPTERAAPVVRACSGNLLTNGTFDTDWTDGWKRRYGQADLVDPRQGIGASVTEIVRGASSRLLHLQHKGLSGVTVFQTVSVPKGHLWFQYEAKLVAREGGMIGFSGTGTATIGILLLGPQQETLGSLIAGTYVNVWEGAALAGVPQAPRSSPTESFANLPNGETVRDRFDVTNFVRDHMGRIDQSQIASVSVFVSVGANDRNASAEAWVDNLVIEVCPGAGSSGSRK